MELIQKIKDLYRADSRKKTNRTQFDPELVGSEAYGETGFDSIELLVSSYPELFNPETVFYDLGSGTGKIVYHIGLLHGAKKSCGIEYSQARHEMALWFRESIGLPESPKISFICGNILEEDWSDATVVYCDNTLFPRHISQKIYQKIPTGCVVFSRAPLTRSLHEQMPCRLHSCITEYGTNSLYIIKKS
jgi:SAM-dependent methyltransferase